MAGFVSFFLGLKCIDFSPEQFYISIFFICSSTDGHLGYFAILAVVNNVVLNTRVQIPLQDPILILPSPLLGMLALLRVSDQQREEHDNAQKLLNLY